MTKRRTKGEGSVYRRGDGRVVGEYLDANKQRRYVTGKNKPEVKAKLRILLADPDEGIAYDSENLSDAATSTGGSMPSRVPSGTAPGSGTRRWSGCT